MKRAVKANARQLIWHDWIRERGCWHCGDVAELHHCAGSAARSQRIHVGQDFVIPLCTDHHRGIHGIHGDRAAFGGKRRKWLEQTAFSQLAASFKRETGSYPAPDDVIRAIAAWRI